MIHPHEPADEGPGPLDPDLTVPGANWPGPFADVTPHARGGLGEVFRATDPKLHRTVAIKCLQDRLAEDPASRQRFLLEAEVTARLEHPGIVPVYGLYEGGGRVAYAMRFVEGRTFAEEITAYHADPADPVRFRRLLLAFHQVGQTVAYAHSRGVIHRDLKPANIMVGKFGEILLVDWGLAKVVGRPEEVRAAGAGETLIPESGDSDPRDTLMGSAVGTPAYMSPEQAAGRWDIVAQASDVYGLGAVLYTVLTGRPPLERGNWPEMQQRIQQGDFPRPRQVNPGVPRALEAACLKAMALKPADRYASATALAADVEHWLAGEPVAAYREPLAARARRWARRHRTLVSAAAVLLIAAVVGLSIGAFLLQRARVETDDQRKSAVAAQRKAEAINRFLIDDLLKQADPTNNPAGDQLTVRQLLDQTADKLDGRSSLAGQPEVEAEVRAVIGHAYEYLGAFARGEPQNRRAWLLRSRLLGPDHREALAVRNRLVFAVVNQDRLAEAEAMALEAMDSCDRVLGDRFPEAADAARNLGEVRARQGRWEESVALRRRAVRILDATIGPDDHESLEAQNDLGVSLVRAGRPAEAVPLLRSVVERRRRINPRDSELPTTLGNLGGALNAEGRFEEAEPPIREAIDLGGKIHQPTHQGVLAARNLLCFALEGQQRWAEAEAGYLAVLADRRRVEAKESSNYLTMRTVAFMARLYAKQERWPDAARYLAELILAERPDPKRTIEGVAAPLAAALAGQADPESAGPRLRECWEVLKVRMWTGEWLTAEVASRYGDCLDRQGKLSEAEPILIAASDDIRKAVGVPAWSAAAARRRVASLDEARARSPAASN